MATAKVALVLDRDFGEELQDVATQMAVWIIDSPPNKAVARELWEWQPKPEHMSATFMEPAVPDETSFAGLMNNIELHHGEYSQTPPFHELEVIGLKPTSTVEEVLSDFGFALMETTIASFRAGRSLETRNSKLETDN